MLSRLNLTQKALFALLCLAFFCFWVLKPKETLQVQQSKAKTDNKKTLSEKNSEPTSSSLNHHGHDHHNDNQQSSSENKYINFSYKKESQKIIKWSKDYPKAKQQLIEKALEADPYKEGLKAAPHSEAEITQRQMGALRVMALRAVVEKEKDPKVLLADLERIAKVAKDPTISKIANLASESVKDSRSFFKDFIEGVSELPVAD